MHELPITESILNIVLKHARLHNARRVVAVHLQIGGLAELEEEWLQRYFDYLSKDTDARGAKLKIERTPVLVKCDSCREVYEETLKRKANFICPRCGANHGTILSGKDYFVKSMEVE